MTVRTNRRQLELRAPLETPIGKNCAKAASLGEQSYGCLAYSDDASVILENPWRAESASEFTGNLAVFRF